MTLASCKGFSKLLENNRQKVYHFANMATIFELRRDSLRRLMRQWGGPTSLAKKLGHSNGSYIAQLAGPHPTRDVSEKTAREIELKLGLPDNWMDKPHKGEPGQPETSLLIDVVAAAKDAIDSAGLKTSKTTFADLVDLVYEHSAEGCTVDLAYLRRLVKLLKR